MKAFLWIAVVAVVLIVAGVVLVIFLGQKQPKCTGNAAICAGAAVKETSKDPSIPTPSNQLYLVSFTYNSADGYPYCKPMWYAIRMVRLSDGKYGDMGPWTSIPVQSGATRQPCLPGGCSEEVLTGPASCNANRPVVGTPDELPRTLKEGYVANVHRQVGTFDQSSEGEIVGMLIPFVGLGVKYSWTDLLMPTNSSEYTCPSC